MREPENAGWLAAGRIAGFGRLFVTCCFWMEALARDESFLPDGPTRQCRPADTPGSGGAELTVYDKYCEIRACKRAGTIFVPGPGNAGMKWRRLPTAGIAIVLAACSPALDWREFTPEGSGVVASFPCRPDRHARTVELAGARMRMEMWVCATGGSTFALSFVDVADPARVAITLRELRNVMLSNVHGVSPRFAPLQVIGMTPNPQATRMNCAGQLPDGTPVQAYAAFFAKGRRAYQATTMGARPESSGIDAFFDGLKFSP